MQKKLMLTNFGNQQLLKAIEEMRRLGILMNPPSKLGEFPLREFHLGGIWSCPKCEGTDKWCILEMDDERGAVCERHGVIVPNVENKGE
ncbi:MAG: hypothetical protein ACK5QN_07545 [Burkholderiales bacterium]